MKTTAAILICALFMAAVSAAQAAVAERVTYQGNLRESGLLVTGSRSMTFRLYDAPAAGTLLWASGATAVAVSTGVFRAVLTPSGLNWESALWLEVEVAGTVLSPREELTAAPFAANALYHSGKKYTNAAAAPASPGIGDLWFDTGTSALKFWSGSAWISTAGSGAAHAATHAGAGADSITGLGAYTLTGNITMSPGTSLAAGAGSLGVSVSTHLVVSGSVNPASNLAVGGPGFSVVFASAVTAGWFYGNGAGLSNVTAAPGGAAGGDLAGTYPSPTLAVDRVRRAGDFMSGQLTTASTITVSGNAFSVGGSSFTVLGGSATLAYQFSAGSFVGDGAGLTGIAGGTDRVLKAGDTMTGALVLPADPTLALQAATKQYVDSWTRPCVNPGNAADIMVPVGSWCVDKYETSVWSAATGGTQYGINGAADYPANCGNGLTGSGQGCTPGVAGSVTPTTPIYARSQVGVKPSTSLTWFQANVACGNAGKELLPNAVWQMAAAGTVDPGALAQDAGPACNTSGTQSMTTGNGTSCLSGYGVENMIGSVWEWVADWGTAGAGASNAMGTAVPWVSASYNGDQMWNIGGNASYNGSAWTAGQVPAVIRGGNWGDGAAVGVFAFSANYGPSLVGSSVGFRCGRRR